VQTQAFGINNRGQVVGEYLDADGRFHGYLWEKEQLTTIDGPDGTGASATDINDRGQIVGVYRNPTIPPTDPESRDGFLLSKGDYTTFDTPGPGATVPLGINNRGQIVVSTTTGGLANAQGFLFSQGAAGPLTPIDPPGPVGAPGTLLATGINDAGAIVGLAANPNAAPDPQPSPMQMPMMKRMSGG
jgi:probable HAF family extracellular repeat protein